MSETEHLSNEVLNEYLDGVLKAEMRERVEVHLADCTVCTTQVEALRQLFFDLEHLPEVAFEKDLSIVVLQNVRPSFALPRRWQWAVGGQIGLAILLMFLSLPVVVRSEWLDSVNSIRFLSEWIPLWERYVQTIRQFLLHAPTGIVEMPDMSVSLGIMIPIILATGLLWLVGNGLLLQKRN